jgi:hypothetical protein
MTFRLPQLSLAALLLMAGPVSSVGVSAGSPTSRAALPGTDVKAAPPAPRIEAPMLGPPVCPWPSESGQRLLDRPLGGPLSFVQATVSDLVRELVEKRHVPLSFIEDEAAPKLTLSIRDGTLRQLLDRIITQVSAYRYRFVGARLLLYPHGDHPMIQFDDTSE